MIITMSEIDFILSGIAIYHQKSAGLFLKPALIILPPHVNLVKIGVICQWDQPPYVIRNGVQRLLQL
jgi:hypothetical protein